MTPTDRCVALPTATDLPRAPSRAAHRTALAFALFALVALPAMAGNVYKWVDANGRVVYSDQPPQGDVKSEVVRPPPPPVNPNAATELEDRQIADKQREKKRADEALAAQQARELSERRREACVSALGQMRALQRTSEVVYRFNERGERVLMTDDARRAAIEREQRIVRENCPG